MAISEKRKIAEKKASTSKVKIVLVVVLALTLGAVVLGQLGGSTEVSYSSAGKDPDSKRRKSRRPVVRRNENSKPLPLTKTNIKSAQIQNPTLQPEEAPPLAKWPRKSLAEATKADPFGLPAMFTQTLQHEQQEQAEAERQAELEKQKAAAERERRKTLETVAMLQRKGVEMVFVLDNQRVAKINGDFYRVGDKFGNLLVTQINQDGTVTVEVCPSMINSSVNVANETE